MTKKQKDSQSLLAKFFPKKKKSRKKRISPSWMAALKIVLVIMFLTILIAGGSIGMIYLDRDIKNNAPSSRDSNVSFDNAKVPLAFYKRPAWVNQDWMESIYKTLEGKEFSLAQVDVVDMVQKLDKLGWLKNVKAQVTPEYIEIRADYLRPLAMVQNKKGQKFYLSNTTEDNLNTYSKEYSEIIVLDYIPLLTIPIPEIKGISSGTVPAAGSAWEADDAEAAMGLIYLLNKMDLYYIANNMIKKPLLSEVESIDISNFAARKSRSAPNLLLNIKDGTQIYWGASWGQAAVYLEADDKIKLARLYETFISYNNSLQVQDKVKYIELRWLEDAIPRLK